MRGSVRAKRSWWAATVGLLALLVWGALQLLGPRVEVVEVRAGPLIRLEVMSGRVRAPRTSTLASQVTGRVLEVPVEEGQQVTEGQLLVAVDDSELRAEQLRASGALSQAKAQLAQVSRVTSRVADASQDQAVADLERARLNFERVQQLVEGGAAAQSQLDDARNAYDVARARAASANLQVSSSGPGGTERALARAAVVQAEASLFAARTRLEQARIVAPSDGVVLERRIEPGETVQPGTELIVLSPRGPVELEAEPDERSLAALESGQRAQVSADAFPSERFEATLRYIAPAIDRDRGTVIIRFAVPEPPGYLRPDMTVSISVETGRRERALMVANAVVRERDSGRPWVLVIREGRATRTEVRLGLEGEGVVEVLEGLKAGEQVIPSTAKVGEGQRVRPRS